MNPQSTRSGQRHAPRRQRQQLVSNRIASVSQRRSPRLQSILSIPPNWKESNDLQSLADQQPSSLQQATSNPRKRRLNGHTDPGDGKPLKRAKLTTKNLKALEEMGRRATKSIGKKSSVKSSITTTTDKDFGTKLRQNNVIYTTLEARDADDGSEIRKLLDQPRASEPPDRLAYNQYVVLTEDYDNELSVEVSAYPLLSKRKKEVEISGYFQRVNHAWSAVDNHLTNGLSDAQPDVAESYRKTDYPRQAVEALSGNLAPSSYNETMPAYAVEFKSSSGDMKEAKLQCAYDGALMTAGAHAAHAHMKRSDDEFYGKTQALTVAYNGENINIYGHHALQVPAKADSSARQANGNGDSTDSVTTVEYHQFLLTAANPRNSLEDFKKAYKNVRNAQDLGYQLATQRKDALWTYSESIDTQTHVPTTRLGSSTNNMVPAAPQEAPQTRPRNPRRKVTVEGPSEAVHETKVRSSKKTRKTNVN